MGLNSLGSKTDRQTQRERTQTTPPIYSKFQGRQTDLDLDLGLDLDLDLDLVNDYMYVECKLKIVII